MKARWLAALLFLASPLSAQVQIVNAGIANAVLASGGGGGGGTCSAGDNFLSTARHAYFYQDASWAVAGDPDDECTGGCSTQALESSANLTEGDDLFTSDMPSGTGTGGVRVTLDGTESAVSTAELHMAADNGDWSQCLWINRNGGTDSDFIVADETFTIFRYFLYINGTDNPCLGTTGDTGDYCASGTLSNTTDWNHICITVDNDGSAGGTDTFQWYINGAASGSSSANIDDYARGASGHVEGMRRGEAGETYDAHEWLLFSSALSSAQVNELCCCGANDSADPSSRDAICGGSACSTF